MQGNTCKLETHTKKADQCITATERNSILQAHSFLSFQQSHTQKSVNVRTPQNSAAMQINYA